MASNSANPHVLLVNLSPISMGRRAKSSVMRQQWEQQKRKFSRASGGLVELQTNLTKFFTKKFRDSITSGCVFTVDDIFGQKWFASVEKARPLVTSPTWGISYTSADTFEANKRGIGTERVVARFLGPVSPYQTQVRSFKTVRAVGAEKKRNPNLGTRIQSMFGQPHPIS